MSFTSPKTWASGYVVLASDLNTYIRDNQNMTAPAIMTTAGDILYASGANTPARLAKDTNSTRSLTNTGSSNIPAWAQVALATGVSGTLPVGNGGTGATTFTANGILVGNGTSAVAVTATMATKGHLMVGDGSGVPSMLSVGATNDHVLTIDSGEATGLKWAAAGGETLATIYNGYLNRVSATTRATIATPASGKKIRVSSVRWSISASAQHIPEVYFGTGANLAAADDKEIDIGNNYYYSAAGDQILASGFTWAGGYGPLGAADEVLSVRTSSATGNCQFLVHWSEE